MVTLRSKDVKLTKYFRLLMTGELSKYTTKERFMLSSDQGPSTSDNPWQFNQSLDQLSKHTMNMQRIDIVGFTKQKGTYRVRMPSGSIFLRELTKQATPDYDKQIDK